jgi:pyruvate formate lyase activating enzyme
MAAIETSTNTIEGLILHIQRLSTEDGPGIRTTVFLKQCPLNCLWCHNPESISAKPQIQWFETRCIGCQTCIDTCPEGNLTMTDAGLVIDRSACKGCGTCARECPAGAIELLGTRITVEALVSELLKDRTYYETSDGGVTFSGGEPTMQPDFVAAVFQRLQAEGIRTALDTCGLCATRTLDKILPQTDMILFDIKHIDPEQHLVLTGQRNERILENLFYIRDYLTTRAPEKRLWIRTPLIPAATATPENLNGIGRFIAQNLDGVVERWELCAFNNLCCDQYRRLGIDWHYAAAPLMTAAELEIMARCAASSGVDPAIVIATGATRVANT